MRGSQLTEKKAARWNSLTDAQQLRMLMASIATGIIAGLLAAHVRLHLGLPGHKAIFWLSPVLAARLLGRCKAGATAGALTASLTASAFGGHIAGGLIGLPLVGLVGIILDIAIGVIERHKVTLLAAIPLIALAATGANLIMLSKRLLAPPGSVIHPFQHQLISYAVFGCLAGFTAATGAWLINRRSSKKSA